MLRLGKSLIGVCLEFHWCSKNIDVHILLLYVSDIEQLRHSVMELEEREVKLDTDITAPFYRSHC